MSGVELVFVFVICYLPILILASAMPYLTRKTESFGVTIPEEVYGDEQIRSLRRAYLRNMLLAGTGILFISAIASTVNVADYIKIVLPATIISTMLVWFVFYLKAHYAMKALKEESEWTAGKQEVIVVETDFRRGRNTVSFWWFIIPVLLTIITFTMGIAYYDRIPAKIPLQYDFMGNVTRWADKSYFAVVFSPVMQLIMTGLFIFINSVIQNSKQQIDAADPEKSLEQNRKFRYRWSMYIVFGSIMMALLFMVTQMSMMGLLAVGSAMMYIPLVFGGVMIAGAVVLSFTTGQGGSRVKVFKAHDGSVISRDEDKYWKLGIIYYNPDDPAVWVEKRFGIGWTINFARLSGWLMLIGVFVLIGLIAILSEVLM